MMNKDIVITLRDGTIITWTEEEYEDYSYEGSVFVVKRNNGEWVGIYNMSHVVSVEVGFSANEEIEDEDN